MNLRELTEYFEDCKYRKDSVERVEEVKAQLAHQFNLLFDKDGNFATKFDPYRTDRMYDDVGTKHQRGTLHQITVAHFLFDEEGDLRQHLHLPLDHLIKSLMPSYGSDLITLHFGKEMSRITRGQYTAIYAWKG
jgi:hypothetical protein